jgi:hypothetical protein
MSESLEKLPQELVYVLKKEQFFEKTVKLQLKIT